MGTICHGVPHGMSCPRRRDTPSVGTATRPPSLSPSPDRAMAALLPPTLARASAALGRTLMPVADGGAFRLQLLDAREALSWSWSAGSAPMTRLDRRP